MVGSKLEPPRVAFSVPRSVGNAVIRNRVRRRLRAAVREHAPALEPGAAYVVRAAPGAEDVPYTQLSSTIGAILGDLRVETP